MARIPRWTAYTLIWLLVSRLMPAARGQDPVANDQFLTAERLFEQRHFDKAEPYSARLATACQASPRGEYSLYHLAECQYRQQNYVKAFENFERLRFEYPGTEFRDDMVKREYQIGEFWLGLAMGDLWREPISGALGKLGQPRTPADAHKRALRAFEAVRFTDPTGSLAPNAAMHIAAYYMSIHDYKSAEIYYAQIVSEHWRSPVHAIARFRRIEASACGYIADHLVLFSIALTLPIVFSLVVAHICHSRVSGRPLTCTARPRGPILP